MKLVRLNQEWWNKFSGMTEGLTPSQSLEIIMELLDILEREDEELDEIIEACEELKS